MKNKIQKALIIPFVISLVGICPIWAYTTVSRDSLIQNNTYYSSQKDGKEYPCLRQQSPTKKDSFLLHAGCLIKKERPRLGMERTLDALVPWIEDFHQTYDLKAQLIHSAGTQPKLSPDFVKKYTEKTDAQREEMLYAYAKQDVHIELPIQVIAFKEIQHYALYVTKKSLEGQSRCALTNYLTAFNALDKLALEPEQTFNLNKHIAHLPGYCKGRGNQDLRFFGGVCGVSTQLFRTSLMHPYLAVLQRHPHSQRFTRYYSDTVYGDDAAIYEMSKQFEIKNTGPEKIYFRSLHKGNVTYLIAAHSNENHQTPTVTLKKQQIGKLQGKVEKQIKITSQEISKNEWVSRYIKKNTSWN